MKKSRRDMNMTQAYQNINSLEGEVADCLDTGLNHFLLLDSWRLSDFVRTDEAEGKCLAPEVISAVDPYTTIELVWQDTILKKHAEYGPLLVELENDSPLIDHYLNYWAPAHLGLLLTSPMSIDGLLDHFRSLVIVNLPDGNPARLRFHDPKKVTGAFSALSEDRCSALMGPLKQVVWHENTGSEYRWLLAENPEPVLPAHLETGWFQFNTEEMNIINQFNQHHLVNNLVTEIISIIDDKKSRHETQGIEYLINYNEAYIKTLVDKGIRYGRQLCINDADQVKRFVKLALFHEALLKKKAIKRVLFDTRKPADIRLLEIEDHVLAGTDSGNTDKIFTIPVCHIEHSIL